MDGIITTTSIFDTSDENVVMAPTEGAAEVTQSPSLRGSSHVLVLAATENPRWLDPAILRPGRLDLLLPLQLPQREQRFQLLRCLLQQLFLCVCVCPQFGYCL